MKKELKSIEINQIKKDVKELNDMEKALRPAIIARDKAIEKANAAFEEKAGYLQQKIDACKQIGINKFGFDFTKIIKKDTEVIVKDGVTQVDDEGKPKTRIVYNVNEFVTYDEEKKRYIVDTDALDENVDNEADSEDFVAEDNAQASNGSGNDIDDVVMEQSSNESENTASLEW